jgi:hypothetical protein
METLQVGRVDLHAEAQRPDTLLQILAPAEQGATPQPQQREGLPQLQFYG